MKKLFLLFSVLAVIAACNRTPKGNPETRDEIINVTVDQVLADPSAYLDKDVAITGIVTHVCKHGGQKLFIFSSEPGQQLRVNAGEGISEFDIALEGSTVTFKGTLKQLSQEEQTSMQSGNDEKHEEEHANPEAHSLAAQSEYYLEAVSFEQVITEE